MLVLDASLLADNLYFIKEREAACKDLSIREITRKLADLCDVIYFSARKLGHVRGGGMCMRSEELYRRIRPLVPLYEGFLTYGGMSVREIEALVVGLEETMDEDMVSQGPIFIAYMVDELVKRGVPVITPAGGLGCHIDVLRFLDHVPQSQYSAGALGAALYIASGVRGMERGTMSEQRNPDGSEVLANMELLRLAMPRGCSPARRWITRSTASAGSTRTASWWVASNSSRSRKSCASFTAAWSRSPIGSRSSLRSSARISATVCNPAAG